MSTDAAGKWCTKLTGHGCALLTFKELRQTEGICDVKKKRQACFPPTAFAVAEMISIV